MNQLFVPAEPSARHDSRQAAPVTVAHGDGIGPEIMEASLRVLSAAGARLDIERIEVGASVYQAGHGAGIAPEAWDSLRRTRVLYKAPITTPQGGGYKSLNVTIRKTLGLYANVRPVSAYAPFVETRHPDMDLVIIRENEEDLYAGIEHRQTDEVYQCLKLITRPGCERIIRHAFEFARAQGRRKVTCFTKDNIMKLTDGLFHRVFDEIAAEYRDLEAEHMIVDIGAAMLADTPEAFDVIVVPNLYGDILSDIAAQISGSVGLAPSANLGQGFAMFEAVHGSAPRLAGLDMANPSGLLLAGAMMMAHLGQTRVAERVRNAWARTIEDGVHTFDIYREGRSRRAVGTSEFAEAVIDRMGHRPKRLPVARLSPPPAMPAPKPTRRPKARKDLVGVDVFVHHSGTTDSLAEALRPLGRGRLALRMISNRGVVVWPQGLPETFCTDHWRCRFMAAEGSGRKADIIDLLAEMATQGVDFIKTEHLYTFDGQPGFSVGQGQ